MSNFLKNEIFTDKSFIHQYEVLDSMQLANSVNELLTKDGYHLIEGELGNAVYEKGNRNMRVLFGAFVKYNKIHIGSTTGADTITRLTVDRKTSGMSGGLIGVSQVKKEMERISIILSKI